jgi:hypothetical protein
MTGTFQRPPGRLAPLQSLPESIEYEPPNLPNDPLSLASNPTLDDLLSFGRNALDASNPNLDDLLSPYELALDAPSLASLQNATTPQLDSSSQLTLPLLGFHFSSPAFLKNPAFLLTVIAFLLGEPRDGITLLNVQMTVLSSVHGLSESLLGWLFVAFGLSEIFLL